MKSKEKEKGLSLVETVVALSVMTIVLTGIVGVVLNALVNAQFSTNQNIASLFAQEGMEVLRNQKMTEWDYVYNILAKVTDPGTGTVSTVYCLDENAQRIDGSQDERIADSKGCKTASRTTESNISEIYARSVKLEKENPQCPNQGSLMGVKAIVSVAWGSSKCPAGAYCHKSQLISCFYKIE